MGVQEILVACLFVAALLYVGKLIYTNMKPGKTCGGSCKCGIDFSDIPSKN